MKLDALLVVPIWIGVSVALGWFAGRVFAGRLPKDETWAEFTRAEQGWRPPSDVVDHSPTVRRGPYDWRSAGDL